MPKHHPNGGATQPHRVLHSGRGDTFGSGRQVAEKAIPHHEHKNGGSRHGKPPPHHRHP